ncbi:MAG TPA: hypothetical protein VFW44_13935 [Bryobacteraceae bacterium]|nr:hypothetical protein [Bryobacteraceae bacterium]
MRAVLLCIVAAGAIALADRLEDTFYVPLDDPAIHYAGQASDRVAQFEARLESGKAKLDYAPGGTGYLPAILKALDINIDSQILVFSRTSIQAAHISPQTPRAIYFNDDTAVGFVQNGDVLELSAIDPKQGAVFYSLDTEKSDMPGFARRDDCLRCHQGAPTMGIPGLMISSVRPSTDPEARESHGAAFITDDRTDLDVRWGGWYVTGTTGAQVHLGNNPQLTDPLNPGVASKTGTQNVTSLDDRFNTSRYLAGTSDIVALMTLEHQTRMNNLMTRIGWDARIALREGNGKLDAAAQTKIDAEIEEMLGYMLFTDEAPLKAPVKGVSSFTKTFTERGPRDAKGRSLRDFDLEKRMFRYPLSYMIYSAAFDGMPDVVRERVYRRLYEILTSKDTSKKFAGISGPDREAVLEIVRATKPHLPDYWTKPQLAK